MTEITIPKNGRALRVAQAENETTSPIKLVTPIFDPTEDENPEPEQIWNDDAPKAENYNESGRRLAESGDLFRRPKYGDGLVLLLPDNKPINIVKGPDLAPVIVDRVRVRIIKNGKPKGGQIAAAHLNAMLKSSSFDDTLMLSIKNRHDGPWNESEQLGNEP